MVILAIFVIGTIGFLQLNLDLLPDITFPVIAVMTYYPGVPPEEVEEFVTKPIEEGAALVEDLKSISSVSQEGLSVVVIEFDWGKNMDWAAFDAREKIDPIIERLPKGVHRPIVTKLDPDTLMPVLSVGMTGLTDMRRMWELADDIVKPELERIPGVAAANIYGGLQREIRVALNWNRLKAYHIPVQMVEAALQRENLNLPGGFVTEGKQEFTIRTIGEFSEVDQISKIVVATRNGTPVYLGDLAEVKDTHKEIRSYARINGQPSVSLSIQKESVANTVKVSDAVREALQTLPEKLPPGIKLTVINDQAEFIKDALHNLYSVAIEGGLLAMVIIFLFLATLRGTLISGISIPLSLLATFALMYFNNMTLNIITMGGLVLAIGRIVDDSVVVLENIYRHLEEGEPIREAAINATGELAMAITAVTLTTMCVFFPIIFVGGMVSTIFTPMSLVVMFGLFASLMVALTIIPTLSVDFLSVQVGGQSGENSRRTGPLAQALYGWRRGFNLVAKWYRRAIDWCLNHRAIIVGIAAGIFGTSLMLLTLVGFEFFPSSDTGKLQFTAELPVGSSVEHVNEAAKQLEEIIRQLPELQAVEVNVGAGGGLATMRGGGSTRTATFHVELVDRTQRERSADEVTHWLRQQFAQIPGVTVRFQQMMGGGVGADLEITIKGSDLATLSKLGRQVQAQMEQVPGLFDLNLDWEPGSPEYQITVDREKAGRLGLTAYDIGHAIQTMVRGTQELTKFRQGGKEYDIVVRARASDRQWIDQVREIELPASNDKYVPLVDIATIRRTLGPSQISRDDRERSVTISASTSGRALSEIVADVEQILQQVQWPSGYRYEIGGGEKDRREAFSGMGVALALGILLIYMILASQFESFVHPLTIMLAIPLEVIGVVGALLLTGQPLGIMVFLGILMLTGIVVSNSILLVQMINLLRERGYELREAIIAGGGLRLRPILMTAIATLFAMIPLALGLRAGSEMWQPLAIAVIGGLTTSTFLTLFVVPVAYSIMEQIQSSVRRVLGLAQP